MLDEVGARYELAMSYEAWSMVAAKTAHVREYRAEAQRLMRALRLSNTESDPPRNNGNDSPANAQLIGAAPSFLQIVSQVDAIADSDIPVLLLGETGVGKDQIARYIHHHSSRNKGPFVEVNCGTIVHELAESHLFGHERGSFTNAVETKVGMVEAASGGTLFLNEVGELPLKLQVKLLSALEEKQFYRVGGTVPRKVDIRVIAATNVDLHEAVKTGRFRADLFFRLAVMTLKVPRLAERNEDVLSLFEHFMRAEGISLHQVDRQTLEILYARLKDFDWLGNVRELRNEVYLCCVMEKRDPRSVCLRMIARLTPPAQDVTAATARTEPVPLNEAVEAFERSVINAALVACNGVIRRAATHLGLPEATLRSKMKKYRINAA
jgi:DNA-binding NtrC family response regulator